MTMRKFVVTAVLGCLLSCGPRAWGQKPAQVEELRQQIRALQKKLENLEDSGTQKSTRVTQIGANRNRVRQNDVVVKIYDLGDLFAIAPPYIAQHAGDLTKDTRPLFSTISNLSETGGFGGGLGGGGVGGGFFNVDGKPQSVRGGRKTLRQVAPEKSVSAGRITLDSLISVVKQVISPEVWTENGGNASVAKLGNALLISADLQTHEQIDKLLDTFRKRWGTLRTISVQAWWLWMDDKEIRDVLAKSSQAKNQPAPVQAFGLVNDTTWNKHLDQLRNDGKQSPGYRAVLTCYNGQTVYTLSGSQSLAVTQVRPVIVKGDKETPGRIAYRPEVSMIQDGIALQVTPIANVAGKTVVLDVHSRIARSTDEPDGKRRELNLLHVRSAAASPSDIVNVLDRKKISVQRLATTLRIPVDRTMLVGGMPFSGESNKGRTLYLFVRVTVQELRNDNEAKSTPKKTTKKGPAINPKKQ